MKTYEVTIYTIHRQVLEVTAEDLAAAAYKGLCEGGDLPVLEHSCEGLQENSLIHVRTIDGQDVAEDTFEWGDDWVRPL
jgi:predicted methyltransferase